MTSNGTSTGNSFVKMFAKICQEGKAREREWIADLRRDGIKAAHPDDGWVNRQENRLQFAYPQFNDGAAPGDRVALGTYEKWRIVCLVDVERSLLFREFVSYSFVAEA